MNFDAYTPEQISAFWAGVIGVTAVVMSAEQKRIIHALARAFHPGRRVSSDEIGLSDSGDGPECSKSWLYGLRCRSQRCRRFPAGTGAGPDLFDR